MFVKDMLDGQYYEFLRWAEDEHLPLYETTEFILKHVLTGMERVVSPEYVDTYVLGANEMEIVAWASTK